MTGVNRVLEAIGEGRIANGYQLNFASPEIIEILGPLGFDFVVAAFHSLLDRGFQPLLRDPHIV